jgi:hypothetical protein
MKNKSENKKFVKNKDVKREYLSSNEKEKYKKRAAQSVKNTKI